MSLHLCILGIDGSGKSTLADSLPAILAAEYKITAGSSGESFRIMDFQEDHMGPKFYPDGLPLSAKLAKTFRRIAKRCVDNTKLYPVFKLLQMQLQDAAARKLSKKYNVDVFVSDCNILLSALGRATNYLCPDSDGKDSKRPMLEPADFKAVFEFFIDKQSLPTVRQKRLRNLGNIGLIKNVLRLSRLKGAWLPDMVIFLDISPEQALDRIIRRGKKIDRHENIHDLHQARNTYLKVLEALAAYQTLETVKYLDINSLTPGETLQAVLDLLKQHQINLKGPKKPNNGVLGTVENLSSNNLARKILNYKYIFSYLIRKWFQGAWREPFFVFSKLGRLLLKDGYSAGVMKVIYDKDQQNNRLIDRIFLEYPLHRAVYDRLQILTSRIQHELEKRLHQGKAIHLFTAPSGFAYDVFRPLEMIASRMPEAMKQIKLVAADLDPQQVLEPVLNERARKLKIDFKFIKGDITSGQIHKKFEGNAPFDIALFVGLSSWLPKPELVKHIRWLGQNMEPDGILVTDSFTANAYSLSGRFFGYKAHYYEPEVYRTIMDFCGFDGLSATQETGKDRINHVMAFELHNFPKESRDGTQYFQQTLSAAFV
jgi:SAM-dependent methyltransferase